MKEISSSNFLLLICFLLYFLLSLKTFSVDGFKDDQNNKQQVGYRGLNEVGSIYLLDDYAVLNSGGVPLSHFSLQSTHRFRVESNDRSSSLLLPEYQFIPSDQSRITEEGHYQPFPDIIQLEFNAFDRHFSHSLSLMKQLFDHNSNITLVDSNGRELDHFTPPQSSYWSINSDGTEWVSCVLREDGRFHAVVSIDGEVYQAEPIHHVAHDMNTQQYHTLATESRRGMIIYRHKDLINLETRSCANQKEHQHFNNQSTDDDNNHDHNHDDNINGDHLNNNLSTRRLLQLSNGDYYPIYNSEIGIAPFNIFATSTKMTAAVVVDAGFFALFGSNVNDVTLAVASVYATSNIVYQLQLNLFWVVSSLTIFSSADTTGKYRWNQVPPASSSSSSVLPTCNSYSSYITYVGDALNSFTYTWRSPQTNEPDYISNPSSYPGYDSSSCSSTSDDCYDSYGGLSHDRFGSGAHLFTNCFPASSNVYIGMSFVGGICQGTYATSISSYNLPFWLTVAHETGHQLGMQHTTGFTGGGGIMGYNSGGYYGSQIAFHPSNQGDVAQTIGYLNNLISNNDFAGNAYVHPYCEVTYTPTCGNGIIEGNEICDDNSGCCTSSCVLRSAAQCSSSPNSTCCDLSTCLYRPSTTLCEGGAGFCSNGQCELNTCSPGHSFCGTADQDYDTRYYNYHSGGCRQSCIGYGYCSSQGSWSSSPSLYLPTGTVCNQNPLSTCGWAGSGSGQIFTCVVAPITYAWVYSSISGASCPCSGTITQTYYCQNSAGVTVNNSLCLTSLGAASPQIQSCTIPMSCHSFAYIPSAWSICSTNCDQGTQSRTYQCMEVDVSPNVAVDSSWCAASSIPVVTQSCNLGVCPVSWNSLNSWTACNATCGGGITFRQPSSYCQRLVNGGYQSQPSDRCINVLGSNATPNDTMTCNTNTCLTYNWVYSAFSSCLPSCGINTIIGSQNRTIACYDSTNTLSTTSHCDSSIMLPLSQTCTVPQCPSYSFISTPWSNCSATCGGGSMTSSFYCWESVGSSIHPTIDCLNYGLSLPSTTQSCNTQTCPPIPPTYSYVVGTSWSPCSVSCGGGVSTRPISCLATYSNGSSQSVSLSYCSILPTPLSSQTCNQFSCSSYIWYTTGWSSCQTSTYTQTRLVSCLNLYTNASVALSLCSAQLGVAPLTVQACCISQTYNYVVSANINSASTLADYGGSHIDFATGLNLTVGDQLTVYSIGDLTWAGWGVSNSWCFSGGSCSDARGWYNGLWCGMLSCYYPIPYPASQIYINQLVYRIAPTYQTLTTEYNDWYPLYDGTRTMVGNPTGLTANITIPSTTQTGTTVGTGWTLYFAQWDSYSADNIGDMLISVTQTPAGCPVQLSQANSYIETLNSIAIQESIPPGYQASSWSTCNATCGGGIERRTVTCINQTLCDSTHVPLSFRSCNTSPCPSYWKLTDWSDCSKTCAGGDMTRSVTCHLQSSDQLVNDQLCQTTKPHTSGECNFFPCPRWVTSGWTDCSASCGDGMKSRTVTCQSYDYSIIDDSYCSNLDRPVENMSCINNPCPHWYRHEWNECSQPCNGGTQTRLVECRMPRFEPFWETLVNSSFCSLLDGPVGDGFGESGVAQGRPLIQQSCNNQPCPSYYWFQTPTSPCSAECNGGVQTFDIICMNSMTNMAADYAFCSSQEKPLTVQSCNTNICPPYQWIVMTNWSHCDVICGEGVQSREIACFSTLSNERVDDTYCSFTSILPSRQVCNVDVNVCYGNVVDIDEYSFVNGICDITLHQCICRAGYGGTYCTATPSLYNLVSDSNSESVPLSIGEPIQLSWSWTGEISVVSILLLRDRSFDDDWPYATYLSEQIVNTGIFEWNVGEGVSDLDHGEGYKIRVWFSEDIYVDSNIFAIADLCDFTPCEHGHCSEGVCVCLTGYTGDDCSEGPCERAGCSQMHSTCNDNEFLVYSDPNDHSSQIISSSPAVCSCTDGWIGSKCRTPPNCPLTCHHNSDTSLASINWNYDGEALSCGSCDCSDNWVGTTCDRCPIMCSTNGKASSDCTSCQCEENSGYFGKDCTCRYYEMSIRLSVPDIFFLQDELALMRFERSIANDLTIAAATYSLTKVTVVVRNISLLNITINNTYVSVDYWLAKDCSYTSVYNSGSQQIDSHIISLRGISPIAQSSQMLSLPYLTRQARIYSISPAKSLPEVYLGMKEAFQDSDSILYRGVITQFIDQSAPVIVQDKSGVDQPQPPTTPTSTFKLQSKSIQTPTTEQVSNSINIILIVTLSILIFTAILVITAILLYLRYYKKSIMEAITRTSLPSPSSTTSTITKHVSVSSSSTSSTPSPASIAMVELKDFGNRFTFPTNPSTLSRTLIESSSPIERICTDNSSSPYTLYTSPVPSLYHTINQIDI